VATIEDAIYLANHITILVVKGWRKDKQIVHNVVFQGHQNPSCSTKKRYQMSVHSTNVMRLMPRVQIQTLVDDAGSM